MRNPLDRIVNTIQYAITDAVVQVGRSILAKAKQIEARDSPADPEGELSD